jgi:glycosyltransferase involved in cell wall biosynthesis
MRVSLLLFTWNEIDGMRAIMPRIKPEWYDELIICDGGSTDGTLEYCREHGLNVFVQEKPGAGNAFLESMERITGDIIVSFSPDGNSIPELIPNLTAKMAEGYDIVIVSRYLDGAKSEDDDIVTSFGNWMFTTLVNVLFRQKITDAFVMFRAFKASLAEEFNIREHRNSYQSQMMLRAMKAGKRIGEIPGDEPKRIGGERKMQPLKHGWNELKMIIGEFLHR